MPPMTVKLAAEELPDLAGPDVADTSPKQVLNQVTAVAMVLLLLSVWKVRKRHSVRGVALSHLCNTPLPRCLHTAHEVYSNTLRCCLCLSHCMHCSWHRCQTSCCFHLQLSLSRRTAAALGTSPHLESPHSPLRRQPAEACPVLASLLQLGSKRSRCSWLPKVLSQLCKSAQLACSTTDVQLSVAAGCAVH